MDIDPKDITIVLGRTKTGNVYATSTPQAPPESEDPLSQLSKGSDRARSPRPEAGTDTDAPTPLAWAHALTRAPSPDAGLGAPLPPFVELCPTAADYARAVESTVSDGRLSSVPVLASRYSTDAFAAVETSPAFERESPATDRLCIALDDPTCVAGGKLLAAFTGRTFRALAAADWEQQLAHLFADRDASSIALLLSYWTPDGHLDPKPLSIATRLLSDSVTAERCPHVGILTGPDPGSFTYNVAKTLLAEQIAARYRAKPAVLVAPDREMVTALEPWRTTDTTGLLRFAPEQAPRDSLLDGAFSAVLFRGHGRSYCGCDGYLCSARPPELDAAAEADSCLFGLDCMKRHYARIDPRRYDTPFMVIDTCGAGNPDSGLDEAGVPPLAILAAAARPLAIATGRYHVRNELKAEEAQMVGAFAGASTAGEGISRMNRMRRQAGLSGDFYLLGDPELPAQTWRGAEWADATRATPGERPGEWHAYLEHADTPYARVLVEKPPRQGTWFVWLAGGEQLGPATVLRTDERAELWINCPKRPDGHMDLWLACRPRRELPPGLVQSAETIQSDGAWWLDDPLGAQLPQLVHAAREIEECERVLNRSSIVARWSPADDDELVSKAVGAWLTAQRGCLEAVTEQRGELFLPWNLVGTHRTRAEIRRDPCPRCERSPTVLHRYLVTRTVERELLECGHCEAAVDRPVQHTLEIDFDAPRGMCYPEPADVELHLTNTAPENVAIGSVAVFVDNGAPVRGRPSVISFKLDPGEHQAQMVSLEFEQDHPEAKLYGLRVVVLANNELYWFGHKLVVADTRRQVATAWP